MQQRTNLFTHRDGITYFPFPVMINEITVNEHTIGKLPSPGSPEPDFVSARAVAFGQKIITDLMDTAKTKTAH